MEAVALVGIKMRRLPHPPRSPFIRQQAGVGVREAESAAVYHSTGRYAAIMSENYGPANWRALVTASRSFLKMPPEGFSDVPPLSPRGALFLALEHERDALRAQADGL